MGRDQRSGPPSWFVILLGIAIVFGVYYLWLGLRSFMASGVTVVEATLQANEESTAAAARAQEVAFNAPTPLPSFTPVPPCKDFVVRVPIAIVRAEPSTTSRIVEGLREGDTVCVITTMPDGEWHLIDQNTLTRRIERVYMHRDILRALNPTPKPTATLTPSKTPIPTNTLTPSETPMPRFTFTERPTRTSEPATPLPTTAPCPTPTAPSISL